MTRMFDRHGLASRYATKSLIAKLARNPPNVIGLHNIHGYFIHYPTLFSFIKEKDIPVIWTFHDCWPFTGHCTYFDRVNCEKWKSHCTKCPMTSYYPTSWGRDRSFKNFADKQINFKDVHSLTVVTPSYWLQQLVKQSFLREYPIKIINNGIDLEIFKPSLSVEQDKLVLGVASPWSSRKGLVDFFELRKILPKSYQIVLIGLTKKQVQQLPEGVVGIQRTESIEELASWYCKATVFVNPTYVDNFPTVNLEALACGTPVVTYNTGGSPESIDKQTGRVVEKGNIHGLKLAIEEFAYEDRQFLSSICRKRAEKFYNQKDRFKDYVQLYEQMLQLD